MRGVRGEAVRGLELIAGVWWGTLIVLSFL